MTGIYLKQLLYPSVVGLFLIAPVHAGAPLWTYSAPNPVKVSVAPGGTATVEYTVTNQSNKPKKLVLKATPGLSASVCQMVMKGSTCTLTLTINGSEVTSGGILGGPMLCNQANPNQCYQPSQANMLNVTVTNAVPLFTNNLAAVGSYLVDGRPFSSSYYSTDSGQSWQVSLTMPQSLLAEGGLSVSCNTSGACASMGYLNNSDTRASYYSTDSGKNWTISRKNPPLLGEQSGIMGVSCNASGACASVGSYAKSSSDPYLPLSYFSIDAGKTWDTSPIMPPAVGTTNDALNAVSCNASGACAAVGNYENGSGQDPLSYYSTNAGRHWITSLTMPPKIGNQRHFLRGVSCNTNGACAAVGFTLNGAQLNPLGYYSSDAGKTWSSSAAIPIVGGVSNVLASVSCNANTCAAVGISSDGTNTIPLSYYSINNGKSWILSPTQPDPQSTNNTVGSVICNVNGACAIVGRSGPSSSARPLSYYSIDHGKNWTLSSTLPPMLGNVSSEAVAVS